MTFYFYDLETSGFSPREARIMQFAGQRTDMQLNPIGEPDNILIKLADDTLPEPDAIMVTGITPQKTISDGITEAEFLKYFHQSVATKDTIFVGYNSVRFDDEFMRFLNYRNFYDAYEWQWSDGRSRWDLLDVVRMTRALRPDGIAWPMDAKGGPSNRLELLTVANGIDHQDAHDALSDVRAVIAIAEIIRAKQPKLFDYLLSVRDKKSIAALVGSGKPFLYTSGRYPSQFEKTTAVATVCPHPKRQGVLVFDLRADPSEFAAMSVDDMVRSLTADRNSDVQRLPIKTLQFNKCPAVAPMSVLDVASAERLQLDPLLVKAHHRRLAEAGLGERLQEAIEVVEAKRQATYINDESEPDALLYEGFIGEADKTKMSVVRAASSVELADISLTFKDSRLDALLPLYKARNYPQSLSDDERATWERFRERRLLGGKQSSRAARYFQRLAELAAEPDITPEKQYLLEELQLYGQSILPVESDI